MSFWSRLQGTLNSVFGVANVYLKDDEGHLRVQDSEDNLKRVRAAAPAEVDDAITLVDLGGQPAYPAFDGSQITNVALSTNFLISSNTGDILTSSNTGTPLVP